MKDGARASGGRPVCSARPMPPKHPTHQIYFPITVPRAPCDRSYGDNDDGAAAAAARSARPLHAGRRGVQQWHFYGIRLHLRQQRRGNDGTPHSITQNLLARTHHQKLARVVVAPSFSSGGRRVFPATKSTQTRKSFTGGSYITVPRASRPLVRRQRRRMARWRRRRRRRRLARRRPHGTERE